MNLQKITIAVKFHAQTFSSQSLSKYGIHTTQSENENFSIHSGWIVCEAEVNRET